MEGKFTSLVGSFSLVSFFVDDRKQVFAVDVKGEDSQDLDYLRQILSTFRFIPQLEI